MGGLIMKTRYTVALSMIAGVGLGAAAIQGLHAQATPKALLVTESEIVDRAKVPPYSSVLTPAMQAAGGQWAGGGTGPRSDRPTTQSGNQNRSAVHCPGELIFPGIARSCDSLAPQTEGLSFQVL